MSQTEDFRGTLLECYEAYNETAEHLVRVPARNVRPIDRERSGTRRRCSLTSCASLRPSCASALAHPKRAPNRSGTSRPPRSPSNRSSPPGPETLRPPAQSNFSGVQHPLEWIEQAHARGWDVLLDAAAFVPTNRLDLGRWHPDFVALSFYKMFGWPTGVGCLLARREALAKLERPWFSGGTIVAAFVQREYYQSAPGAAHFEDGTVNYLNLPGVEIGLRFLDRVGLERIHDRVGALGAGLLEALDSLRQADGSPAAVIYGRRTWERRGATIAFNFLHPDGRIVDERFVDRVASARNVSLRTGCFCNPGAGEIAFTIARETLIGGEFGEGMTLDDYVRTIGLPSGGAIRASLGIASNFADLYRFKAFAREFIDLTTVPNDLPARTAC